MLPIKKKITKEELTNFQMFKYSCLDLYFAKNLTKLSGIPKSNIDIKPIVKKILMITKML